MLHRDVQTSTDIALQRSIETQPQDTFFDVHSAARVVLERCRVRELEFLAQVMRDQRQVMHQFNLHKGLLVEQWESTAGFVAAAEVARWKGITNTCAKGQQEMDIMRNVERAEDERKIAQHRLEVIYEGL